MTRTHATLALAALGLAALLPQAARAQISGFQDPGGFTTNTNGNGTVSVSGSTATLTTTSVHEAHSLFFNTPQSDGPFRASFTYQDVGGGGSDGAAFVLQDDPRGLSAGGGMGAALGYGANGSTPISPSAAVEFRIYVYDTSGFDTNGTIGGQPTGTVNLESGDPILVNLTYTGTTLTETLTDQSSANTFTASSQNVNLAGILGAPTAYVGFTGATGDGVSTQTVSNFVFTPAPEPSQFAALGIGLLGLGALAVKARRRTALA